MLLVSICKIGAETRKRISRIFLIIITITTFPAWDTVDVGLPSGCTGVVVAAVVVACDVVPAICMRLPLRLITVNRKFKERFLP